MIQPQQWIEKFTSLGAYWRHGGDLTRPHVILTSGNHSDAYLNCTRIIQRPDILQQVAAELVRKVGLLTPPDWVFGSPFGSITLAERLAANFVNCLAGFTEPDGERFKVKRFEVGSRPLVVVADDVLSTGGTTEKTIAALEEARFTVLDYLLVIANRTYPKEVTLGRRRIVSLIDLPLVKWEPNECPLCQQGSTAIKAKDNWAQLTGSA